MFFQKGSVKVKRCLKKFHEAHGRDFESALSEVRGGQKLGHWMWYIFPQVKGLGESPTSQFYSINSLEEAVAFLKDPLLGGNLREITKALLSLKTDDAESVFGWLDAKKLRSSMTLFRVAGESCGQAELFQQVLDKYFGGEMDERTMEILIEREL